MDLLALLFDFFGTVQAPRYLIAFGLLWAFWAWYSIQALDKPSTRSAIRVQLQRRKPSTIYRDVMTPRLAALGQWLTPETVTDHPRPGPWPDRLGWYYAPLAPDATSANRTGQDPFSWRVLDTALQVAVIYPLLFLLVSWSLTGRDGRIGGAVVLPAEKSDWLRYATICSLSLVLISSRLESWLGSSRIHVIRLISGWAHIVAFAIALAGAVMGADAFVLAVAVAFAVTGGVAGAGVGAFAFSGAVAFAGAVALAGVAAAEDVGVFAGAVAVAFVVSFALAGAVRRDRGLVAYLALIALLLGGLLATVARSISQSCPPRIADCSCFSGSCRR